MRTLCEAYHGITWHPSLCNPRHYSLIKIIALLVPTAPPSNFRLDSVDSTSITVRWDKIPFDERNGLIVGYDVKYQRSGAQSDDFAHIRVGWYPRQATLENLEVGTEYLIQVAGLTEDGIGVYSNALEVDTLLVNQCKFQILQFEFKYHVKYLIYEIVDGKSCIYYTGLDSSPEV